jgi:DNA invertase Pin-like site-specific DNA recombinase
MYDAVEAGEINIVVYHEVDRIARDVTVASNIDSIHQKTGVDIFIVPLGRFLDMNRMEDQMFFYNFAIMAQMFSKAISGKATNSQKRRSTAGVKRNSTVPYGLKDKEIVSDLINGSRKVFALDTDVQDNYPAEFNNKAAVVKEIYRKYNDGQSLKSIARWMNNTIPTLIKRCEDKSKPEVQTKSWDDSTIRYMLKNPVYFGGSHYKGEIIKDANGDFLITNEPLVTSEYWINTQALLDSNTRNYKKRQVRHTRTMSPLHYIARCSCGGQLKRSTSEVRGTPFYALKCIVPSINKSLCSGVSISQIQLEKEIFEYTKDILSEPEILNYFIGSDNKPTEEISISPEEQGLIDDMAETNRRIDLESDKAYKQMFIERLATQKAELNKLRMSTNIVINKVKSNKLTVEAFEIAWNSEDKSDVNAILATIYKSIIISKSTIGTRELNLLKKDGWHVDPKRVTLEHHDGSKIGLDDPLLA